MATFERIDDALARADAVISATRCPYTVLSAERVAAALPRRSGRPLVFVDIAVPRDLDPAIGRLAGCSLGVRLVVLDDDDRLAGVDEPVEQAEQLLDVGEVEAGGRLVEDVDAALLGHVGGQLEPPPLAAGQRSERLAEDEVGEADIGEPVEDGVRASPAPKNSSASVTDIASTSLMSRPPRWWSSTDAWNRFPSHSSQVVATPAIIARSV